MKIKSILELPTSKLLLCLGEKGEVRYSELSKLIASRGTLSLSLKETEEEGLTSRRVVLSKPVASYYSLTAKGKKIASLLREMGETV